MKLPHKKIISICTCFVVLVLVMPQKISAITYQNLSLPNTNVLSNSNNTYTITFNANGGETNTNNKIVTFKSTYGKLPTATRKNYDFLGWYTFQRGGTEITELSTVNITNAHTLYAHWIGKAFTLSLIANGGELTENSITIRYGSKYILPTPTKENYNFSGWYTALKGGDRITSGMIIDDNSKKKLYAHWTEKKLNITFIGYNGQTYQKEVICGKKYGTLPAPQKTDSTFGGWYTWDDYSNYDAQPISKDTVVTEDDPLILFARWYNK